LDQEVAQMTSVRDALGDRVMALAADAKASQKAETDNMRASLDVGQVAGGEGEGGEAEAEEAAEDATEPEEEAALVQTGASASALRAWEALSR